LKIISEILNNNNNNDKDKSLPKNEKQNILWAIVNNAGINIVSYFETIPEDIYYNVCLNVLLKGPMNVTRAFLPLLYGRQSSTLKTKSHWTCGCNSDSDGGRIVNISSCSANFPAPQMCGYAVFKKAISLWTHCLRMELSPLFHIWCSVIEPGGYCTQLLTNSQMWDDRILQLCPEDIANAYNLTHQLSTIKTIRSRLESQLNHKDITPVIDCIVHAVTSKYPQSVYSPGWGITFGLLTKMPMCLLELVFRQQSKYMRSTDLNSKQTRSNNIRNSGSHKHSKGHTTKQMEGILEC